MLSNDIQNKLDFIVKMTSTYRTLMLPLDWWYSSVKKQDGWVKIVDLLTENKDEIDAYLTKHNISYKLDKKRKIIVYQFTISA